MHYSCSSEMAISETAVSEVKTKGIKNAQTLFQTRAD